MFYSSDSRSLLLAFTNTHDLRHPPWHRQPAHRPSCSTFHSAFRVPRVECTVRGALVAANSLVHRSAAGMPRGVLGNAFHWTVCACVPAGGGGLCATAPVRAAKVSELMSCVVCCCCCCCCCCLFFCLVLLLACLFVPAFHRACLLAPAAAISC